MFVGFIVLFVICFDVVLCLIVVEFIGGEMFDLSCLYLVFGGVYLWIGDDWCVCLFDEVLMGGLCLCVDFMIVDVVWIYGLLLLLVVLIGMGKDGFEGARVVKYVGGCVFVEVELMCVVYGMLCVVVEVGFVDEILLFDELFVVIVWEVS